MKALRVILVPVVDPRGFVAECPGRPDLASFGRSRVEALARLEGKLEVAGQHDDQAPSPSEPERAATKLSEEERAWAEALPKPRARRAPRATKSADEPFVRVVPSGVQVSVPTDAIVALGQPAYVTWEKAGEAGRERVFLLAAEPGTPGALKVSYLKERSIAIITLPAALRSLMPPRRYSAVASRPGVSPRHLEILIGM